MIKHSIALLYFTTSFFLRNVRLKKKSIDSEGFYTCSYVLKSNQGSDHIVLIRKIIKQCVFSLENMHDTIIWLTCKLDK